MKKYSLKKFSALAIIFFASLHIEASNYYWVNGTGNWSDYATHWATTSGGNIFQTQVPTSFDNVYFDANSFSSSAQTVTANQTIVYCLDMDWTGATNNPAFAALNTTITLKVYGSLTVVQNMDLSFNGIISMEALFLGKTIRTNNQTFLCPINFNGFGGEWTLQDSLTTTKNITLNYGILRTNNNNMRCKVFGNGGQAPCSFYMGTSTLTLPYQGGNVWLVTDTNLTLDADSSFIRIYDGYFLNIAPVARANFNVLEFDNTSQFYYSELRSYNGNINKVIF